MTKFKIKDFEFNSRLLLGTGKFPSVDSMIKTVENIKPALVTVALKRFDLNHPDEDIFTPLTKIDNIIIMPNTSGAKNANEAYKLAHIGRDLSKSPFVKIEIHPDTSHLLPDPIETFYASKKLVKEGFYVMPYISADPVLAKRLEDIGCVSVMPLGAPIGSGQGLLTRDFIKLILQKTNIPVIVDAGLRTPSEACSAMELGVDAVLINSAIALADDCIQMAKAFDLSINAGRITYLSGPISKNPAAVASSPELDFSL